MYWWTCTGVLVLVHRRLDLCVWTCASVLTRRTVSGTHVQVSWCVTSGAPQMLYGHFPNDKWTHQPRTAATQDFSDNHLFWSTLVDWTGNPASLILRRVTVDFLPPQVRPLVLSLGGSDVHHYLVLFAVVSSTVLLLYCKVGLQWYAVGRPPVLLILLLLGFVPVLVCAWVSAVPLLWFLELRPDMPVAGPCGCDSHYACDPSPTSSPCHLVLVLARPPVV